VPPADRIFGKPYPIKDVEYRRYARRTLGNLHSPRIKGIPVPGRMAIYFSAEDISTGLVGESVDGIVGYVPQAATELVANLAASYVKLPATTQATTKMTTKPSTKPSTTPAKK
jgi:hypothetical protein